MLVHNQDLSRCASTRSFSYPQAEAEVCLDLIRLYIFVWKLFMGRIVER